MYLNESQILLFIILSIFLIFVMGESEQIHVNNSDTPASLTMLFNAPFNQTAQEPIYSSSYWGLAPEDFPMWLKYLLGIISTLLSLITVAGNVLVVIAFFLERNLRSQTNFFILSLAVTDLLIGLFSVNLYTSYLLIGNWHLGKVICDLWLSLDYTACLTSQYTVFCITLDRYLSVKIPAKYRNWRTDGKVIIMIAITWIVPAGIFFTVNLGWDSLTGSDETSNNDYHCKAQFTSNQTFNIWLTIFYFWITLTVMSALYIGIYRVAVDLQKKSDAKRQKVTSLFSMAGQTMSRIGVSLPGQAPNQIYSMTDSGVKETPNNSDHGIDSNQGSVKTIPTKPLETSLVGPMTPTRKLQPSFVLPITSSPIIYSEYHPNFMSFQIPESDNDLPECSSLYSSLEPQSITGIDYHCFSYAIDEKCQFDIVKSPTLDSIKSPFIMDEIDSYHELSSDEDKHRPLKIEAEASLPLKIEISGENDFKNTELKQNQFPSSDSDYVSNSQNATNNSSNSKESENSKNILPVKRMGGCPKEDEVVCPFLFAELPSGNKKSEKLSLLNENEKKPVLQGNAPIWKSQQTPKVAIVKPPKLDPREVLKLRSAGNNGCSMKCQLINQPRNTMLKQITEKFRRHSSRKDKNERARTENRARKAFRTISIIMGAFVLCWTPYHILILAGITEGHVYNISYWLCYINSPINPFCYALANVQFKKTFIRILKLDFRRL